MNQANFKLLAQHIFAIEKEFAAGSATEHIHRPELKTLIEELAKGVTGTMRVLRAHGRVRLVCTNRIKNKTCSQPSGYLDLYEQQLIEYLNSFHIPEDYQHRILEAHRKLQSAYDDVTKQKAALERRLQRAK